MSTIVSPSRRRLNLIVPCDAGCDGPIWSVISSDVGSGSTRSSGVTAPGARATLISILRSCPREPRPLERIALGHQRLAARDGVVLAQRVALELRVHEDAAEVGVPGEAD